uniref:Uncharacterized protein n=1 Tax=Anguilla anguilla TaxID=7936 RepID=A0A0E9SY85_ANGAN
MLICRLLGNTKKRGANVHCSDQSLLLHTVVV